MPTRRAGTARATCRGSRSRSPHSRRRSVAPRRRARVEADRCSSSATMRSRSGSGGTRSGSSRSWRRRPSPKAPTRSITMWRPPVEPRARDGRGGGPDGARLRARRQRRSRRRSHRERAPRSPAGRRGALRRVARGAGPGNGAAAAELRATGRRPFVIPLGASTPLGAAAYALAIAELLAQSPAPE